ncbi:tetratricopeptide repeat protein, partial [bacterium]
LKALEAAAAEADPGLAALEIGRGLVEVEAWQTARSAFERSVAAQPDLAEGWAFLAEVRQKLGLSASEEIERALTLSPHSNTVQALAAIYYRRAGRPDISLIYLHAAANEEPGSAYWQVELGKALSDLDDVQDALLHFLKATELEPENAQGWIELARFSLNYSIDVERVGLPAARKALLLAPEDANALDIMGALLFSQNDLVSAERFLQQSLQQDAANPDAQLHLGQVYLASGDLAAARPFLEEAARLTPETAVGRLAERLIQKYYPTR